MVNIICPSRYKINRTAIKSLVNEYLAASQIPPAVNINIIFFGRKKMHLITLRYKQQNQALPVLSFNYPELKSNLLGEIMICYPLAVLLAAERNKRVDDMINQLIRHGLDNLIKHQDRETPVINKYDSPNN